MLKHKFWFYSFVCITAFLLVRSGIVVADVVSGVTTGDVVSGGTSPAIPNDNDRTDIFNVGSGSGKANAAAGDRLSIMGSGKAGNGNSSGNANSPTTLDYYALHLAMSICVMLFIFYYRSVDFLRAASKMSGIEIDESSGESWCWAMLGVAAVIGFINIIIINHIKLSHSSEDNQLLTYVLGSPRQIAPVFLLGGFPPGILAIQNFLLVNVISKTGGEGTPRPLFNFSSLLFSVLCPFVGLVANGVKLFEFWKAS